jgi:hypothetical protein
LPSRVTIDLGEIEFNLQQLGGFVQKAALGSVRYWDSQVEAYAKVNARWTDRSSNARNGLMGRSGVEGDTVYLVLAHKMHYGIYLEVRWSGKYAIIQPTLEIYGPKVMKSFEGMLDRYGKAL